MIGRLTENTRRGILSTGLGAVAQLGERLVRNEEVGGSIPLGSTTLVRDLPDAPGRREGSPRAPATPAAVTTSPARHAGTSRRAGATYSASPGRPRERVLTEWPESVQGNP